MKGEHTTCCISGNIWEIKMKFIRERVLSGKLMAGAWCNLGSSLTVEMAAGIGYDWILLDQEHGPGDNMTLLHQIQAIGSQAAPIVRIAWNEMPRFKRALDLGAMGIMVPYVENAEEAAYAVSAMQYSPVGTRGVASSPRTAGFGPGFKIYYEKANDNLLTVVQIESAKTLRHIDAIADVDGVDVLFVGPLDLSVNLNVPLDFDQPDFKDALKKVARAARKKDKAAGILLPSIEHFPTVYDLGYRFIAVGSDGDFVMTGMKKTLEAIKM